MPKLIYPVAVIFLIFYANPLLAQETTAEIVGIIMENQNPIAGATVTAIHLPTGTNYSTTTRKDGRYNLPNLKIGGPYTITVSFVGYKDEKQENVTLLLGQEFEADFTLTPGSKSLDTVVVQSVRQDKVFNNNRTGSEEIITRSQIERLPTIIRSLQNYTRLTPSANGLNFGGRSGLYNNITIDGANFNSVFGLSTTLGTHIPGQPISLEAIDQIEVNISPFDVRQGGFSGANINVVSRSGTNTFKGSAYTYLNGPGIEGYKVGDIEVPKEEFDYNMKGFSLGGPIVKNKVFFFVNGEREIITTPATTFIASDALHPPGEKVSFANADTLNRLRQFLIDKYGYDPGKFQEYKYRTQRDKISAKIDWSINSNNTFTIKYNYLKSYKDNPSSDSHAPRESRQPGTTGLPFSGTGYTNNNNYNIFIAELNTSFGNTASNKLQIGYSALRNFRSSLAGQDFPLVDIMNGQRELYTSFGYEPLTYNNLLHINIYHVSNTFTLYKEDHEITLGTQNYIKRFKTGFAPFYEGAYRFSSLEDFYNSARYGVANAVRYNLGYALTKDGSFPFAEIGSTELAFLAQDNWRMKKNFILTYGLRVDVPIFQNKFQSNPYVSALTFRDGKHYDVGQKPGTNILLSPRVGFNWDITDKQEIQIRGGAGLFAGPPPLIWISNQASNNGVQFNSLLLRDIPFSPDINKYRPNSTTPGTSYNLVFTDKDFKYPQALKLSLAVDKKLPGDIVGTLEATYSKDINSIYFQNVNLPSTGITFKGSDPRMRFYSHQIYSGTPTATPENPDIKDAILMTNSKKGYAYTFTLQLQKTTADFHFGAAYTYSRAESLNDGGSLQAGIWKDRPVTNDPNAEESGYSDFYIPHRIIAYASYRKEYARYFATSFGLIFEAAPSGVGCYTYKSDVNNDGVTDNDLMYIPKDENDIVLVPVNTDGGIITDTRTSAQIWAQLNNYISQDSYLSSHRGQVAKRNATVFPFFAHLDLNITQDFYLVKKKGRPRQILSFTVDLINVGNFLNKNWGSYKTFTSGASDIPYKSSILQYEGIDFNTGKPRFSFPYLDETNEIPLVNSYTDNTSLLSRWQVQIGIRYTFR